MERVARAGHGRETVCIHEIACLVTCDDKYMSPDNPLGKLYNASVVFSFDDPRN